MSMGDRIAVLNDGAILQIGTPRQVYCQPVSPVVARQLGQPPINLLPLRRIEGKLISERNDEICPDFAPAPQDRALLGIRPEDIEPAGGRHPAKVLVVEDTGPARILLVRWLGFDLHILATRSLTVRAGEDIFPRIRTNRAILWPMENSA
jgi:multiple sugar transport system ATP-binding protein